MITIQKWLKRAIEIGLALMFAVSMSACSSTSWKEEVLLHDGSKIIVKRSQSYGGRHEIGQSAPIKEHSINFVMPNSNQTITWVSEYGKDIGRTNFKLLAVHILNDIPYIVATPNLCLSYNKWGRPNPPYVFFKYVEKEWRRISIEEFPAEFKTLNVAIYLGSQDVDAMVNQDVTPAETIKKRNSELTQPEYKTILREVLPNAGGSCGEMVYDGKGGWTGIGWFRRQPSKEACLKYCEREEMPAQYCPCANLFKGK